VTEEVFRLARVRLSLKISKLEVQHTSTDDVLKTTKYIYFYFQGSSEYFICLSIHLHLPTEPHEVGLLTIPATTGRLRILDLLLGRT